MEPSSSPSPSEKLLVNDPKPKSDLKCASSSSTTSMPPPPGKRTRDQPNLSDCHCCSRRINYTNPKDRLQPLESVWRIVLLCRKCRKSVRTGRTCSYCFQESGNSGDLYTCKVCERKIHKNCVKDYGNCMPWCYLAAGLEGFRVCVDCWVPELLKNSISVFRRGINKSGAKYNDEARDILENVVQEAKCGVGKKVKRVSKAKESELRMVNGEVNVVDSADGAFDLLAEKDVDNLKAGNTNCGGAVEAVNDAELAGHSHRTTNSSSRIFGANKSLVNLDSSRAIGKWKGLFYKRSGLRKKRSEDQKLRTCANSAENERMNRLLENDSCIVFGRLNKGLVPYKRDRKRKIWQLDNENPVDSESISSQQVELKNLHSDDAGTRCSMKSGADISEESIGASMDRRNGDKFGQELLSYRRTRFKKKVCPVSGMLGADISEESTCASMDQRNGYRFGQELVTYKRTRFTKEVCQVSGVLGVLRESRFCYSRGVTFKSEYCQPDNASIGAGCPVKGDVCGTKWDRYHLKYVKRIPGAKRGSNVLHYGTFLLVNQVAASAVSNSEAGYFADSGELIFSNGPCNQDTDRYSLKYTKRVKRSKPGSNSETELHSDTIVNNIEISATGLTMNCSAESRTLSDVSFDSFTTDLPK